jgi:16S rRNA processing protein RimM
VSLVRIGRLGRPHGVHGEQGLDGGSLTPLELHAIKRFAWTRGEERRELTLVTARPTHRNVLVRFEGVADRDGASALTNGTLWADEAVLPDPGPGVAYVFQLEGLAVETADGRALGTVAEVMTAGAHPVYIVRGAREWMLPATPEVVKRVDLAARRMVVDLPPGLEEL